MLLPEHRRQVHTSPVMPHKEWLSMLRHGQPVVTGRVLLGARAPCKRLAFENVTVFIHRINVFLFQENKNTQDILFYKGIFNLMIHCEHLFLIRNSEQ